MIEDTTALLLRLKNGDLSARDTLVENNLGLVHHVAKRFIGRGYDEEELFQIGTIGLIKAIDHFEVERGLMFSTYAVPLIMGEIKRFLRDDGIVKISRGLKENGWKVKKAVEKLSQKLGRDPTLEEIAKETGLHVTDVVQAGEARIEVESIYRSVYESDGSEIYLVDQIVMGGCHTDGEEKGVGCRSIGGFREDHEKERLLNQMLIEKLLGELKDEERNLILLRYFGDKTQIEIAEQLGISQVQVSRLEKKILLKMREKI